MEPGEFGLDSFKGEALKAQCSYYNELGRCGSQVSKLCPECGSPFCGIHRFDHGTHCQGAYGILLEVWEYLCAGMEADFGGSERQRAAARVREFVKTDHARRFR